MGPHCKIDMGVNWEIPSPGIAFFKSNDSACSVTVYRIQLRRMISLLVLRESHSCLYSPWPKLSYLAMHFQQDPLELSQRTILPDTAECFLRLLCRNLDAA